MNIAEIVWHLLNIPVISHPIAVSLGFPHYFGVTHCHDVRRVGNAYLFGGCQLLKKA